ncbi:hypothetical protein OAQ15_03520 [Flavobacteriaceae bacterium]|nr:hypothetical protein [Flavobacteriaceae bacterium]
MEKSKVVQIAKKIEKSISNLDVKKAIVHSNDEAKTRDYLVEPFFKILGYREIEDIPWIDIESKEFWIENRKYIQNDKFLKHLLKKEMIYGDLMLESSFHIKTI